MNITNKVDSTKITPAATVELNQYACAKAFVEFASCKI